MWFVTQWIIRRSLVLNLQTGILKVNIGINYSWFIILALITLSLTTQFTHLHPDWSYSDHLIFGIATSILFFVSVLLHELGHSVLALKYHIPVKAVTLFVLGGVAHWQRSVEILNIMCHSSQFCAEKDCTLCMSLRLNLFNKSVHYIH